MAAKRYYEEIDFQLFVKIIRVSKNTMEGMAHNYEYSNSF